MAVFGECAMSNYRKIEITMSDYESNEVKEKIVYHKVPKGEALNKCLTDIEKIALIDYVESEMPPPCKGYYKILKDVESGEPTSGRRMKLNCHINTSIIFHHINELSELLPNPEDLRAERFHSQMDGALEIMREGLRLFCHYSAGYFEEMEGK